MVGSTACTHSLDESNNVGRQSFRRKRNIGQVSHMGKMSTGDERRQWMNLQRKVKQFASKDSRSTEEKLVIEKRQKFAYAQN